MRKGFRLLAGSDAAKAALVNAYRRLGHQYAVAVNPLKTAPVWRHSVDPTLQETDRRYRELYCGDLSIEFDHIQNEEQREWLISATESESGGVKVTAEERVTAAHLMRESEVLDTFLHTKFRQLKRYSLEGCEAMLPGVWALLDESSKLGVTETVVGMAHRGRTNLLCGLLQYPPSLLFHKIRGNSDVPTSVPRVTGDVISHIGHLTKVNFGGDRSMEVRVLHNPSHLEGVNPVALGRARVRSALPLIIHGDAALAGQGVNYEACQMSRLKDFTTGGAVHMVVNNQIGFTAEASTARSTRYATDLFKAFEVPIWRASSPDAVMRAARLAARFRQRFGEDAVVDVVGFRRYGHNELDEPTFTNPAMYAKIDTLAPPGVQYAQKLVKENVLQASAVEAVEKAALERLNKEFAAVPVPAMTHLEAEWERYVMQRELTNPPTGVDREQLLAVGHASIATKEGFVVHKTLVRSFIAARSKRLEDCKSDPAAKVLDWATCEALALGSLVAEDNYVRLTGQDSGRGTFSQRHMELTDSETGVRDVPLSRLPGGGKLEVVNSFLSELAVVAFEYGVSIDSPKNLAIWEAQFGDFFNQAQVSIDTFVANSFEKWQRPTALTLMLPSGMDGAASEHSSARVERFLQMSSEPGLSADPSQKLIPNWRIINPTTPANIFHALRRQLVADFRVPLIVVAPKGILRHPLCVSSLSEIEAGTGFVPVIADESDSYGAGTVLWCSGKTYYDLVAEREKRGLTRAQVAIVRLEELVPFPYDEIRRVTSLFSKASKWIWCNEEHENQGVWNFVYSRFYTATQIQLSYAGRDVSATPAVGSSAAHKAEVAAYLDACFEQ